MHFIACIYACSSVMSYGWYVYVVSSEEWYYNIIVEENYRLNYTNSEIPVA